jgi:hypothetical protein
VSCLFVIFAEFGSHVVEAAQVRSSPAVTWCKKLHLTQPSADCPHKRRPGTPPANLFDEASHHCAVLSRQDEIVWATSHDTLIFDRPIAHAFTRPPNTPFHPPKQ